MARSRAIVSRRWLIAGAIVVVAIAAAAVGVRPGAVPAGRGVDAQLDYLDDHWQHRNSSQFGSLEGTDCVNFTSQGLLARGWTMNPEWWQLSVFGWNRYAKPWISSTAFRDYLAAHAELGSEIDRSDVRLGDIVQFDWDNSGNRDHTATVSRIDTDGTIRVIQHSADRQFESVDDLLSDHADGDGTAYFWHPSD